ncbi:MAG: methyltransferase domain-containing protein [Phaeospirillum sp.]|nr:methyltransferase domain-containing protein [Phaeospirillum sp.]
MSGTIIGPAHYAAWRSTPLGHITERLESEALLGLAGPLPGRRVLDIGCGDGTLSGRLVVAGANVTAIDADPDMIAAARTVTPGASFLIGDGCRLPFAEASFDLAVMNTVLCLVEGRRAALSEAVRVLRGGGRLVIGELGRWSSWAAARRIRGWLGAGLWRQAHFSSAASLADEVTAAGLMVEAVRGAVFFPPWAWAARLVAPFDPYFGRMSTFGAAYIAMAARKP